MPTTEEPKTRPRAASEIPYSERRLQVPTMHYAYVGTTAFPETRKLLMQLHAQRAAEFEYLKPDAKPVPYNKDEQPKDTFRSVFIDGACADPPRTHTLPAPHKHV